MARAAKAERPIQSFMLPDFKSSIPSREVSDQLVHLYLRTFESAYRILHIPSFQKECAQYWNDPQTASTGFVVKLLLVMAIGSCFYQNENNDDTLRSLVPQWVYAGQWWLSAASEKSGLNLAGLQVHCLMLLAHQTNALGGDLIWISAGSLLRTAFNMGLHRDPKYFPKMSTFYSELRRRLWATILEMAIQSSLDSGMPPLISLQDFDCEPPSNIDDAEIDEATKTSPASKPNSSFTQTSIQITLLKSLPTRLEVAILINDFRTDPSYDKVLRLGADITNACRESALIMQSHLSFPIQRDSTRPTEFHKNLLDLFTRRYLLTLHRPFAIKAKTDPRFYFSRKVCLESAMTIVSYVGDLSATSNVQDDFSRLMVRGRGAFRDVMFSDAAIAICLELITQLEEEASNGSSNAALTQPSMINKLARSAREPIIQAVKQMVELAARRIALGETNVKGHVLLSAALAQITAMEAGEPPEHAIFEAAKQSAKSCYALLRARTTSAPADLDEQHAPEERSGLGTGGQQDFDFDVLMQDESLNLDISNSWLFSGWEENNLWL
ncbi:hypothetical protein MMC08_005788 [Hypocenomyce scalaris]|nr:hypothetical protein [Hypocenomyce scalaris]